MVKALLSHFYRQGATVIIIVRQESVNSRINQSSIVLDTLRMGILNFIHDLTQFDDLKTTINTIGKTYGQIDVREQRWVW